MRYNNKRFTALLLIFTMVFQVLPLTAFASERTVVQIPNPTQHEPLYLYASVFSPQNTIQPTAAIADTVLITAPADRSVVTAPTNIVGTVSVSGMTKYTLAYAPVQQRNPSDPAYQSVEYTVFKESTQSVNNGVLGVFDPTLLPNGHYTILLTVETGSAPITRELTLSVEGELKVGNFSMNFVDMDIPIYGFPLSVIRTYDSRVKDVRGNFTYGWDMKLSKATLSENGTPGSNWKINTTSSFGMKTYTLVEEKPHEVVIHWGNGKTDKFALKFNPSSQAVYPLQWVQPYYVTTNGSKSKLEPLGQSIDLLIQQGQIYDYDFNPYNPKQYKLTALDGTVYIFDDVTGLEHLTKTNGDVITFTKDSVTHSDGKSIVFERDAQKRVTKISGPTGHSVSYRYDDREDLVSVTDIGGNETQFSYDDEHFLTDITDPRGVKVARNEYDADGRLVATVDANGKRIVYDHDLDGRRTEVTDRLGNTTLYVYDTRGNLLSVTDGNGNKTTHTYDANGQLATTTDALGNTARYSYSQDGRMLSMTNALGLKVDNSYNTKNELVTVNAFGVKQAEFAYDSFGQIAKTTDALGNTTNYGYLSSGRLNSISDGIGAVMQFTYDNKGNVVSTTNGAGETATFTYDADGNALSKTLTRTGESGVSKTLTETYQHDVYGNVTKTIYPDGTFVDIEYDSIGNKSAVTDSSGRRTTFEYDIFGNLKKISYFDGTFEFFDYDAENRNIGATDRYGLAVSMTYDNVGNLLRKTYKDGASEGFTYDAKNRLTKKTDKAGATTTYEYDSIDRNISITDALGNKTGFTYDAKSQLSEVRDPKGNVTKYEYDLNGKRTKVVMANGGTLTTVYDARGRIRSQTDQNGYITTYKYDGFDRLIGVANALGNEWVYRYNSLGELTSVTDPAGNKTTYEYDDQSRLVKTTNAAGKEKRNSYDNRGNLVSVTDYSGVQTFFSYDASDRLSQMTVGSKSMTFTYNAASQIETVTDASGVTRYAYDTVNRLASEQKPDGATLSYEYDAASRIKKLATPYGNTAYTYDALGRLKTVTDKDGAVTNYEYDANGNLTQVAYSNGMTTVYTYNAVNALIGERITNNANALVREYVYTVGSAGERLNVQESGNRTVSYTYDALYRLTGESVTDNAVTTSTTYAYDAVSNRTSKTAGGVVTNYTYNNLNQLTGETGITYQYDLNGNRTKKTEGTRTTTYTYDEFNRLSRATVQEGANVAVEEYGYDWKGNRIRKSRELDTTKYLVDTNNWISHVVAETNSAGALKAFYTRGGDTLINMNRGGAKSYYLFDGQGSVRMLANEANLITDTWDFNAWGETTFRSGVTDNDYLYAGERFDKTTELYHLRARYMDPKTGTFMTMDTYEGNMHDPASLHKYMYANANPITNTDPTGMMSLGEMSGALSIQNILDGASGLNYWAILDMLHKGAHSILLLQSKKNVVIGVLTDDPRGIVNAISSGMMTTEELLKVGDSAFAMSILEKALPTYGAGESVEAFLKAARENDVEGMLASALIMMLDTVGLYQACFDGDTPVAIENGFKRIDEIQVGDKVWSYNVETSEKALKEITQVLVKESYEILHLETTEGGIDATANHPFYVTGKGWVAAGDLVVGDKIHTIDGETGTVTGLKLETLDKPISVYNLEIEDFQSYFVGNGVLVHNVCILGRGSTGRTEPRNLMEEMAYEATIMDPFGTAGEYDRVIKNMNDASGRWDGWDKWQVLFTQVSQM